MESSEECEHIKSIEDYNLTNIPKDIDYEKLCSFSATKLIKFIELHKDCYDNTEVLLWNRIDESNIRFFS